MKRTFSQKNICMTGTSRCWRWWSQYKDPFKHASYTTYDQTWKL